MLAFHLDYTFCFSCSDSCRLHRAGKELIVYLRSGLMAVFELPRCIIFAETTTGRDISGNLRL